MGYFYLFLAIIGEIIGTNLLKASNGFTMLAQTLGALLSYGISFYFLALSMKTIPLSIVYTLWAGIGIVLTTAISLIVWKERLGYADIIGIGLILSGVLILNLLGKG